MNLKDYIRSIKDYPKKGILFRDITTLIKDEKAFTKTIELIVETSKKYQFEKIRKDKFKVSKYDNLHFFKSLK